MTERAWQETAMATTAGLKYTGAGVYGGCSIRETAGAVAVVRVRDGAIGGQVLETLSLVANGSLQPDEQEEVFSAGLYVEVVSGAVEFVLLYRDQ